MTNIKIPNFAKIITHIHWLKSTSLYIYDEKISALAKELETAGKLITSKTDIRQGEDFIKAHHAEVMSLYDKFVV